MSELPFYVEHDVGDVWVSPTLERYMVRFAYRDGSLELMPERSRGRVSMRASGWPASLAGVRVDQGAGRGQGARR